jgi:hypothetical protein
MELLGTSARKEGAVVAFEDATTEKKMSHGKDGKIDCRHCKHSP